ncbi:MAG: class I SAM-dependent methyltransferase [Lachnospiraceae bacterium]|nr:class I SAM-dependent methyltransferase [Lachnospiraceae bacterium]
MAQQNIYDNEVFFENFRNIRANKINFNDLVETPILHSLLPEMDGKDILDIGCGMGQHAMAYSKMGARSVLGIDLSEKMLAAARQENQTDTITYRQMAMEDIATLTQRFDVVTSSLVFDYIEDFDQLMKDIFHVMKDQAVLVFSMSHPIVTAYDGQFPRWTRTEHGERLYTNLRNYCVEGIRTIRWTVENYELYHRTFSSIVSAILEAGFVIEACRESETSEELREQEPEKFGGTIHRPDFIFFLCRKPGTVQ